MIRCICGAPFNSEDGWAQHVAATHRGKPGEWEDDYDYQVEADEDDDDAA